MWIYHCKREIDASHEAIFMIDNLEDMLKKKKGKPHYVPHKEELLKYMDEGYFEKNKEETNPVLVAAGKSIKSAVEIMK